MSYGITVGECMVACAYRWSFATSAGDRFPLYRNRHPVAHRGKSNWVERRVVYLSVRVALWTGFVFIPGWKEFH